MDAKSRRKGTPVSFSATSSASPTSQHMIPLNGGASSSPVPSQVVVKERPDPSKPRPSQGVRTDSLLKPPPVRRGAAMPSGAHIRRRPPSTAGRAASPFLARPAVASLRREIIEHRADPSPAPSRHPRPLRAKHRALASPPMPPLNVATPNTTAVGGRGAETHFHAHHAVPPQQPPRGGAVGGRAPTPGRTGHSDSKRGSLAPRDSNDASMHLATSAAGVGRRNIVLDAKLPVARPRSGRRTAEGTAITTITSTPSAAVERNAREETVRAYRGLCESLGQSPLEWWVQAVLGEESRAVAGLRHSVDVTTLNPADARPPLAVAPSTAAASAAAAAATTSAGTGLPRQSSGKVFPCGVGERRSSSAPKRGVPGMKSNSMSQLSCLTGIRGERAATNSMADRMNAYCNHLRTFQQKRDSLRRGRKDVQDALSRFVALCKTSYQKHQQQQQQQQGAKNSATGMNVSKIAAMTSLEAQATTMTDGLRELQRSSAALLLRIGELSREVRRPLGTIKQPSQPQQQQQQKKSLLSEVAGTEGATQREPSPTDSAFSPQVHRPRTSPPSPSLHMNGAPTEQQVIRPVSTFSPLILPSPLETPTWYVNVLRHEESAIVQELIDVCTRVREALAETAVVEIADEGILETPLFMPSFSSASSQVVAAAAMAGTTGTFVRTGTGRSANGSARAEVRDASYASPKQSSVADSAVCSQGDLSRNASNNNLRPNFTSRSTGSTWSGDNNNSHHMSNKPRGKEGNIFRTLASNQIECETGVDSYPFFGVALSGWLTGASLNDASSPSTLPDGEEEEDTSATPKASVVGSPRLVLGGGRRCFSMSYTAPPRVSALGLGGSAGGKPTIRSKSASLTSTRKAAPVAKSSTTNKTTTPVTSRLSNTIKKPKGKISKVSRTSSMSECVAVSQVREAEKIWEAIRGIADISPSAPTQSLFPHPPVCKESSKILPTVDATSSATETVTVGSTGIKHPLLEKTADKAVKMPPPEGEDVNESSETITGSPTATMLDASHRTQLSTTVEYRGESLGSLKREAKSISEDRPRIPQAKKEESLVEAEGKADVITRDAKRSVGQKRILSKQQDIIQKKQQDKEEEQTVKYSQGQQESISKMVFSTPSAETLAYQAKMVTRIVHCWRRYVAHKFMRKQREEAQLEYKKEQKWQFECVMASRIQDFLRSVVAKRKLRETLAQKRNDVATRFDNSTLSNRNPASAKEATTRPMTTRERFECAKENRRKLLDDKRPSSVPTLTDTKSSSAVTMPSESEKKPPMPIIPSLDLKSRHLSTHVIDSYSPEAENFDVAVLHRLLRAPKAVLYTARVLCDTYPTRPDAAFAVLAAAEQARRGSSEGRRKSESFSFVSGKEVEQKEKEAERQEKQETKRDSKKAYSGTGPDEKSDGNALVLELRSYREVCIERLIAASRQSAPFSSTCVSSPPPPSPPPLPALNVAPTMTPMSFSSSTKESVLIRHSTQENEAGYFLPFSVRVDSFVEEYDSCREIPVVKSFPRPFERWGTAYAFQQRAFSAAATYAWKLIFSHTPHDDYKQRMLRTREEQESRLERVEQRNRMILACYCVRSEKEWLKEASKDLGFIAHIWNPKKSLDPNDPDFERHCRETYEFVEDFLYQCFPTITSLDDAPTFLMGAGIYFVLREVLSHSAATSPYASETFNTSNTSPHPVTASSLLLRDPTSQAGRRILSTYESIDLLDALTIWCRPRERPSTMNEDGTKSDPVVDAKADGRDRDASDALHAAGDAALEEALEKTMRAFAAEETGGGGSLNVSSHDSLERTCTDATGAARPRVRLIPAEREEEVRLEYPKGFLVGLSERLAYNLLGISLDLEVCEDLDAVA